MKHLAALEATIVILHTVAREAQGRLGRKRRRGDYLALEARLEAKRYMTAAETKLDSTEMQRPDRGAKTRSKATANKRRGLGRAEAG